jgi:hypothetical protein
MGRPVESSVSPLGILILLATLAWTVVPQHADAKQKQPVSRTIKGSVLDEQDHPIVGATVELTDKESGKKFDIYSQAGGQYEFSGLEFTHDYEVQARYQGRTSEIRHASSLDDSRILVLNLRIPSGGP